MKILRLLLVPTVLCGAAMSCAAAPITYTAVLNGASEVPPTGSPATGMATYVLDGNMLSVNITFSGLVGGPAMAAHIHCCAPIGTNAPVVVPFAGFPAATSGSYSNIFDLSTFAFTGGGSEAALIAGFNAGTAYTNIHNATNPNGEIRGQIMAASAVPEPGTLLLMGSGAIGLLGFVRRKIAA